MGEVVFQHKKRLEEASKKEMDTFKESCQRHIEEENTKKFTDQIKTLEEEKQAKVQEADAEKEAKVIAEGKIAEQDKKIQEMNEEKETFEGRKKKFEDELKDVKEKMDKLQEDKRFKIIKRFRKQKKCQRN